MLIVLSGLPGVGKTAIAREVARQLPAVHLRVDSIEQEIRDSGVVPGELDDAGYRVAQAVAEDNLRIGRIVVADSVNPWPITREAWRAVAQRAQCAVLDVEVICSDRAEHRRRVDTRRADIARHRLPTWREVVERDYRPWDRERLVIDTAGRSIDECVRELLTRARTYPAPTATNPPDGVSN